MDQYYEQDEICKDTLHLEGYYFVKNIDELEDEFINHQIEEGKIK